MCDYSLNHVKFGKAENDKKSQSDVVLSLQELELVTTAAAAALPVDTVIGPSEPITAHVHDWQDSI